jgi:hypothetical protein
MKHHWRRTHITAQPFDNPHIRRIINKSIELQSIRKKHERINCCDPFARSSFTTEYQQGQNWTTNDLNPEMPTAFHLEANEFCEVMRTSNMKFDLVVWDPPYNLSLLKRLYDGIGKELEHWQTLNPFGKAKDAMAECIVPNGHVISFGFGSRGFGRSRGFEKIAIYNFEPSGSEWRYNIQIVVERKVQMTLDHFTESMLSEGIEEE